MFLLPNSGHNEVNHMLVADTVLKLEKFLDFKKHSKKEITVKN